MTGKTATLHLKHRQSLPLVLLALQLLSSQDHSLLNRLKNAIQTFTQWQDEWSTPNFLTCCNFKCFSVGLHKFKYTQMIMVEEWRPCLWHAGQSLHKGNCSFIIIIPTKFLKHLTGTPLSLYIKNCDWDR